MSRKLSYIILVRRTIHMAEVKTGRFIFKYGGAKGIAEVLHEVGAKKPTKFTLKAGSTLKTKPENCSTRSEEGFYVLEADIDIPSSSTVANIVSGASICGPEAWLTEEGTNLRDYFQIPITHKKPYKSRASKETTESLKDVSEDIEDLQESIYPIEERVVVTSGSEYVYAYYFPSCKELALLKKEKFWPIKIGKAHGDAPTRISQQMDTSTFEEPIIALVAECKNCDRLESALHSYFKACGRHIEAKTIGTEWFRTNPQEIEAYLNLCKDISSEV